MAASRFIIVTATDDTYLPLALDLLRSLRRLETPAFDIGVLDLGLSDAARDQLAPFGVTLKQPGIDIDYPGREAWEKQAPFYRAMTSRPFLRDYFPGYDAYMWMDGDTWAQTGEAVATMLPSAAADDALYAASEIDRDYRPYFDSTQPWNYHFQWYKRHFGEDVIARIFPRPMINSGVMAMAPRSPVWEKWADIFGDCLKRIPRLTRENFMSEQLSLNVALYTQNLPLKVMPARFNWLSLYALPMVDADSGLYVRPTPPRGAISVIHITHQKKLSEQDLGTTDGKNMKRALTFAASGLG